MCTGDNRIGGSPDIIGYALCFLTPNPGSHSYSCLSLSPSKLISCFIDGASKSCSISAKKAKNGNCPEPGCYLGYLLAGVVPEGLVRLVAVVVLVGVGCSDWG